MADNNITSSVGIVDLLTVLFVGLKLGGVINWSWWWVLSPIWISTLIVIIIILLVVLIARLRGDI